VWQIATRFHTRPSSILGIDHLVDAYIFDKAVLHFGTTLEEDLEESAKSRGKTADKPEVTKDKKQKRLAVWLNVDEQGKKQFRDPAVGR
jgi:hypothetical protein